MRCVAAAGRARAVRAPWLPRLLLPLGLQRQYERSLRRRQEPQGPPARECPGECPLRRGSRAAALSQLCDTLRLRWNRDGDWLQFRSTSYYDDRLKEVPNRLLERWAAVRREHGLLRLEELVEIVQLSDAQLQGRDTAEGARE